MRSSLRARRPRPADLRRSWEAVKGYTTREVAEVLGLPADKILSWSRSGLISPQKEPNGSYVFSFQDIVLLRTARALLDAAIPTRRVREALSALRTQLPVGRPLSAVRISAVGERVIVQDGDAVWEPNSGQLQIDFAVAEVATAAAPVARRARLERGTDPTMTADDWYDSALDLEAVTKDEAIASYSQALALDPSHSDAHLNLGRLLHEDGRVEEAETHYREAVGCDPGSARAFYNLGVVLEDRGFGGEAIEAYEMAVRLTPDLSSARFNLSRLLEQVGRATEAIGHLAEYKRLVEGPEAPSNWRPR